MPFLNPDRTPTIRYPQGHPIAVIAAFNVIGELVPRYFSIEDDYSELFKYQVSAVKAIKNKYMMKEFYCSYDAHGYRKDIVLCFDVIGCRWVVGES